MKNILYFLIFIPTLIFGQSQNPPSVEWKQIETEYFRVIFPQEIEKYALETAYMMDTIYKYDTEIFQNKPPKKVDLFLYNRSVVSNAYAASTPRRMVWYLKPPNSPSLTLSPWNKTLGIHEFRHITQYNTLNTGFTKLGSIFAGKMGQTVLEHWAIPNWFYEGDAVYIETKYSNSGRGRMPSFTLPQRTILLNDQKISYEKAFFRSYKTYYPNHYYLGYHMVTHVNRNHGEKIWDDVLFYASSYSFWPYAIERSLKNVTGKNVRQTYKATYNELDSIWTEEANMLKLTDSEIINQKKKKTWTNYFDTQIISKDTLLVLKSGYDDNTSLYYLLENGEEKRIREITGENISYSNNKVVWTRYKQNIRYGEESYSNIVVYDLKTNKLTQITKKGKYFSPELSPDGTKIVAIEIRPDLITKIVFLELDGKIISSVILDDDVHPMLPVWTQDSKSIIYLQTTPEGESMKMLNIKTAEISTLIEPQWTKFDKPTTTNDYVFFNYDYSGITNIYALNIDTKAIFQVTSRKFSANQVAIDEKNNSIYFTDYNLNGFDIAKMDYNPKNWIPLENITKKVFEYFNNSVTEKSIKNINTDFSKNIPTNYKATEYKHINNLINVHSWYPVLENNLFGIEVISDNTDNTLSIISSISGNPQLNSILGNIDIHYKKYFPILGLGFTTGKQGHMLDVIAPVDSIANWYENSAKLAVSIPLNLSSGIYYRSLNLYANGSFVSMTNFNENYFEDLNLPYTQLLSHSTSFSFTNRRFMSFKDLLPVFGQSISFGFKKVPAIFDLYGEQIYLLSTFYLPGLMKHHGFKIEIDFEQRTKHNDNVYPFSSTVSIPRGYYARSLISDESYLPIIFNKILKTKIEYQFPLLYPDINIPYFLYIKRIRANIFYDYAQIYNNENINILSSTGAELIFDFNILRMNFLTLNAGVQASYIFEDESVWVIPLMMGGVIWF